MTKEILLYIMNEGVFYYIVLIGLAFLINWILLLKAALVLSGIHFRWHKFLPWVIPGAVYSMVGKIFIPQEYFGIINLVVFYLILYFVAKMSVIRSLLTAVLTFFLGAIGLIFAAPFIYFNPNLVVFFFQTPLGILVGAFFEMLLPLIIINLSWHYGFYPTKKLRKSEFFGIMLYFSLLSVILLLTTQYVSFIINAPSRSFLAFFLLELFLVLVALVMYIFKHQASKREEQKRLMQHLQQQLELYSALVGSLSGEQREFKNQLQVLRSMVELGQTDKINSFIDHITTQMLDTKMLDFENPILASALLEEIVQGRELGIKTKVQVAQGRSLKELNDSFEIGKALKLAIGYFFNNRAMRKDRVKEVTVLIEQEASYYHFTVFYGNNDVVTGREVAASKEENQNLKKVEAIVKELCGKLAYGYTDGNLIGISFKIPL